MNDATGARIAESLEKIAKIQAQLMTEVVALTEALTKAARRATDTDPTPTPPNP